MPRSLGSKVARTGRSTTRVFWPPSLQAVFLAALAVALSYGAALLIVLYAYGRGYGMIGKEEWSWIEYVLRSRS